LFQNPAHDPNANLSEDDIQEYFDSFFEDIFIELAKYGEIEEMNVCDNVGDHLGGFGVSSCLDNFPDGSHAPLPTVGNIYVRYRYEEDASKAVDALNNRFYAGKPIYAELSPVTDFREGNEPLL
jgi:splicing factor U2AF subunit